MSTFTPFLPIVLNVKMKKFNQVQVNSKSFGLFGPYSNYISLIIIVLKNL